MYSHDRPGLYTPVNSYYKLVKKLEDDPEFDKKRSQKKLRRYVESHDHAIRLITFNDVYYPCPRIINFKTTKSA